MILQGGGGVSVYTDDIFVNNLAARSVTADVAFIHNGLTYMYYDYDVVIFKILEDCQCFKDLDVQGLFNGSDIKIKK